MKRKAYQQPGCHPHQVKYMESWLPCKSCHTCELTGFLTQILVKNKKTSDRKVESDFNIPDDMIKIERILADCYPSMRQLSVKK